MYHDIIQWADGRFLPRNATQSAVGYFYGKSSVVCPFVRDAEVS